MWRCQSLTENELKFKILAGKKICFFIKKKHGAGLIKGQKTQQPCQREI